MYRTHTVAVVVPAHDEAPFVGRVVGDLPAFVDRIYVVDDASTDGTHEAALAAAASTKGDDDCGASAPAALSDRVATTTHRGRVVLLSHGENRGPGGAVATGYLAALAGDADLVATIDGDGQMDPGVLPRFLDPLVDGGADYATGTRLRNDTHRAEMPRFRLFGNYLLTYLTRIASGYWGVTDPQNGYTAISVDALERIEFDSLYDQYGFLNDVLVRLKLHGMRVTDVEMRAVYGDEESGIRYRRFVPRLSWLLLQRFVQRLRVEYLGSESPPLALPYLFGRAEVSRFRFGVGFHQ